MRDQSCDVSYQGALNAATAELDKLFEEAKRLQNRIEQVDGAIEALKQLLEPSESSRSASSWTDRHLEPALSVA